MYRGHPNIGGTHMFGCPPLCLDIPCMFGCPHMLGCPPVCLIAPHMFGHLPVCLDAPYVWMPLACFDAPICVATILNFCHFGLFLNFKYFIHLSKYSFEFWVLHYLLNCGKLSEDGVLIGTACCDVSDILSCIPLLLQNYFLKSERRSDFKYIDDRNVLKQS